MNSKRIYVAKFWCSNPRVQYGGYYIIKEFQAVSHKIAERQAERYAKSIVDKKLRFVSIELKESSNGKLFRIE